MGDVLPPKRQTVVERLKRRFELYRKHQNACLPRYEQAENGLYEAQRQETLLLKQRYLESKAKKAKNNKSDHHRSFKESVTDGGKSQVHTKPVKRPIEDPVPNPSVECTNGEDAEKPSKILRTDITSEKLPDLPAQQPQLPSFPVQIVQQFAKTPHSQQSQTIQTSSSVPALGKPLTSPVAQPASTKPSQEPVPNNKDAHQSGNVHSGASIECKQEKDCSQMDLCQFKSAQNNSTSDRLSDTFPSLGFTDDSGDDVIHPDLLKDLIDDVFTNSTDIMKDFNFDDSVGSIKDEEDATKDIISDLMKESSPIPIRPFQTESLTFVNNTVNQQQQPPPQQQQPHQQQQQQPNGLFKNISSGSEVSMSVMVTSTSTPTTSAANFYTAPTQRLPTYGNSSLNIPNGLGLDFKLTEPSPAALTLKQMAEQHQNMQQKQQQQQLVNSPLTNRPFNQDTFSHHINHLRSTTSYLPGTNPGLSSTNPKTPNSNNMFTAFDRQMNNMNSFANNEPLSNLSISPNTIFETDIHPRTSNIIPEVDHSKQPGCMPVQQQQQPQQQQKPPTYVAARPLPHFSENSQVRLQNPVSNQQQRPMARQFQNNMQIMQTPQMHTNQGHLNAQQLQNSHDLNRPQHHMMHQSHSSPYVSFPSQQPMSNSTFHMSQNISYSNQFASNQTMNRPPPEYKTHQSNLSMDNVNIIEQLNTPSHVMFNQSNSSKDKFVKPQRPPNVTITTDGSVIRTSSSLDWRHIMNDQQNRPNVFHNNYNNFVRNEHPLQQPQMFNQYRIPGNQMLTNRMVRPNMVPNQMIMQQRPRVNAPQRQRNPSATEQHTPIGVSNNALPAISAGYNGHQDLNRNDGSQINLDFLDNIESSASDLLNFDQVMQGEGAHFPLLDDMEILGK